MNNEKSKIIYLDTNTFYLFASLFGFSFNDINTNYPNIDNTKLKNEFVTLLYEQRIGFSTNMLFEVISHFRNNQEELKRLYTYIHNIFRAYGCVFRIDRAEPFFTIYSNTNSDVDKLIDYNISEMVVLDVVEETLIENINATNRYPLLLLLFQVE